jgi:chitin disaccharide deacetylase
VRYLIVNADDFGQSDGINRGIMEAHEHGIVTSASLMVDEPAADQAARLSAELPGLSIGLHVMVTDERASPVMNLSDTGALGAELARQMERCVSLLGRLPDHLDSHHNVHLLPEAAPCFRAVAEVHGLVLRGHSAIRYFPGFYGQWDGETHLEHVGVDSLIGMVEREVGEGVTEFGCHPGYVDPALASTYAIEREAELETLCDPRVRAGLDHLGIELINSRAARELLTVAAARG